MTVYQGTATTISPGVEGDSTLPTPGVKATNSYGSSPANALEAFNTGNSGSAIYGEQSATGAGFGVAGRNTTTGTTSGGAGVLGESYNYLVPGVIGNNTTTSGTGVKGTGGQIAVFGYQATSGNYAGYFSTPNGGSTYCYSNFTVSTAFTKSWIMDHPLDPTRRDLLHASVESDERKNVYDGIATADSAGEAVVQMPDWFELVNTSFRYQLTPIGAAAPGLHIKQEMSRGRFGIAAAAPGQRICWQVTGILNDAASALSPFKVEQEKPTYFQGLYRAPQAFGQPETSGVDHALRHPRPPPGHPDTVGKP